MSIESAELIRDKIKDLVDRLSGIRVRSAKQSLFGRPFSPLDIVTYYKFDLSNGHVLHIKLLESYLENESYFRVKIYRSRYSLLPMKRFKVSINRKYKIEFERLVSMLRAKLSSREVNKEFIRAERKLNKELNDISGGLSLIDVGVKSRSK